MIDSASSIVYRISYIVYGVYTQGTYKPRFLECPLPQALEPECRILMFVCSYTPQIVMEVQREPLG